MVKVSIEVRNGATHFNVAVGAQSIKRAVRIVRGSYPHRDVRVKFPIDPEGFFVEEPAWRLEREPYPLTLRGPRPYLPGPGPYSYSRYPR
jgi:hypothetical protein